MPLGYIKDGQRYKVLGGGGQGGHNIWNRIKTALTRRPALWFKDAKATDDSTNSSTDIEVMSTVTSSAFTQLPTDGTADGIYIISDGSTSPIDASTIGYDNTSSGMTADDVQDAIDELKTDIPTDFVSKTNGGTFNGNVTIDKANGTTTTDGTCGLAIGNETPSGTAGNCKGMLALYGAGSKYVRLRAENITSNRDIYLPDKGGDIALISDTELDNYWIKGWILSDNNGTSDTQIFGCGCVRILNKHYVEVHFATKIETVSSASTGYLRLNVATLRNRNSNIPEGIVPTFGGVCTIFDADGKYSDLNGYGCIMAENTTEWKVSRMYATTGTNISPYVPQAFSVGQRIVGTAYGYLP